MDWTEAQAPTLDEMERLAMESFAGLPDEFRALTGDVVFMVQEFPDKEVIDDMELESEFEILGLFSGADLADRDGGAHAPHPTMIFL
jgi:predicted Zn-dependent protease with MMP-like domain